MQTSVIFESGNVNILGDIYISDFNKGTSILSSRSTSMIYVEAGNNGITIR